MTVGEQGKQYDVDSIPIDSETAADTGKRYDIDEAYKQHFGHVRPPFPLLLAQSRLGVSPVGTFKALKGSFKFRSSLGTEFTHPTILDGWQMPNEPVISFEMSKNVIETQLNRGDRVANVIEEVNLNNYEITLRGVIINETNFDEYPEEEVRRIREICEKGGSVTIDNPRATILNIKRVQIIKLKLFEIRGYAGKQAYEIDMKSDEDFDLELIDDPERL